MSAIAKEKLLEYKEQLTKERAQAEHNVYAIDGALHLLELQLKETEKEDAQKDGNEAKKGSKGQGA